MASQQEGPSGRRVARRPPYGAASAGAAILAATRRLFDERGVAEAQIEDIARAVGINRAIVYRHFTGKEELFALALVGYLDELAGRLTEAAADRRPRGPSSRRWSSAFVDYGVAHPAFVDCAHSLMRRTGTELFDEISEDAMLRLGRASRRAWACCARPLEAGVAAGDFHVDDPVLLANTLYATGLGGLQLARVGLVIDEPSPGVPQVAGSALPTRSKALADSRPRPARSVPQRRAHTATRDVAGPRSAPQPISARGSRRRPGRRRRRWRSGHGPSPSRRGAWRRR